MELVKLVRLALGVNSLTSRCSRPPDRFAPRRQLNGNPVRWASQVRQKTDPTALRGSKLHRQPKEKHGKRGVGLGNSLESGHGT